MELSKQLVFFMAMVGFLCVNQPAAVANGEQEDFSYTTGAWKGPEHWGDNRKDWETCKTGRIQSPVAIDDGRITLVQQPKDLHWSYLPQNATMKNLGHHVVIEWKDEAGAVRISEMEYPLKQVHWHIPSENTVNGRRFDLELHMLHQRPSDQRMAMISIFYEVGDPDPFFAKVEKYSGAISKKVDAEVEIGIVDPKEISGEFERYYRLNGSITIPPCTEGVIWTINEKVRTLSAEQLDIVKEAVLAEYEMNARPVQPLNGRVVQFFG